MQVSSDSDPANDPFGDAKGGKKNDSEPASPLGAPQMPDDSTSEPSPLPTNAQPSFDETLPPPPSSQMPSPSPYGSQTTPILPPEDLSQGISTPGAGLSCEDYRSECARASRALERRDISTITVGLRIEGAENIDYPCECPLSADPYRGRNFSPTTMTWKATGVCHKPLYFEDVQLERYGHSWNPVVQPFMSAAHFFVSVPLLPYNMGVTPPGECIYTLGYYRPGSCAPYVIEPFPLSLRGAVFEAVGVTAFTFSFWPPQ
jgi:hypothetical protein